MCRKIIKLIVEKADKLIHKRKYKHCCRKEKTAKWYCIFMQN